MPIDLYGRSYTVDAVLPDGSMRVLNPETRKVIPFPKAELNEALSEGAIKFLDDIDWSEFSDRRLSLIHIEDILNLRVAERDEMRRRYRYVIAIQRAKLAVHTKDTMNPVVDEVAKKLGDSRRPAWITVWKWFQSYRRREDIRDLIPAWSARGSTKTTLKPEVAAIVKEKIETKWLTGAKLKVPTIHAMVRRTIDADNEFRDPGNKLRVPHISTLYDAINRLKEEDEHAVLEARNGKPCADGMAKQSKVGPRPEYILERVEIDATKLDLFILEDTTLIPLGRPYVTFLKDVHSKSVLGFYVGFVPPSWASVAAATRHAVLPKDYVRKEYPDIVNGWDVYGVPATLVPDNAMEYYSNDIYDAFLQAGTELFYAPRGKPQFKASVENHFKQLNETLIHQLPGNPLPKTAQYLDRKDFDPKKNAVITYSRLLHLLHKWVVDIYQQSEHRGYTDSWLAVPNVRRVPAEIWAEGYRKAPPRIPGDPAALDIILGSIEHRVLTPKGIELFSLRYNDDALWEIRARLEPGEKVRVKYNPNDIGMIHVYDELRNRYVAAPCLYPSYANGVTLFQHEVFRTYAITNFKGEKPSALAKAKVEVFRMVEEDAEILRAAGALQKRARFKENGKSQKPDKPILPPIAPVEPHDTDTRQGASDTAGPMHPLPPAKVTGDNLGASAEEWRDENMSPEQRARQHNRQNVGAKGASPTGKEEEKKKGRGKAAKQDENTETVASNPEGTNPEQGQSDTRSEPASQGAQEAAAQQGAEPQRGGTDPDPGAGSGHRAEPDEDDEDCGGYDLPVRLRREVQG